MKYFLKTLLCAACVLPAMSMAAKPAALYQVSTSQALLSGLFQGAVSFKTVEQHGDFGLGSVKDMDGELIAYQGKFYRILPTGKMNLIPPTQTTPYAVVTFFKPTMHFKVSNVKTFKDLIDLLNQHIKNRNIPYAISIVGQFNKLELRAVRGAKPPYPPFSALAAYSVPFRQVIPFLFAH